MQKTLYDQRKAEFDAQVRSFAAKITQQETTLAKLRSDEGRYEEREKISKQVQEMRDTLYKSGASSLIDLLSATDQHLEIQRTMEFRAERHHRGRPYAGIAEGRPRRLR